MGDPYLLHHLLEQAATTTPSKEAIVDLVGGRRSFEYQALHGFANDCAAVVQQRGLARRDRVAVYLPESAIPATW